MIAFDVPTFAVLGVACAAVSFDVRTRRIPNALTFGAALAAVAYAAVHGGWSGIGTSVAGWSAGAAVGLRDSDRNRTGMHFMAALKTSRHGEQGQAIIEMALTLPLLLLVVLGMFDFGLLFQRFEVVTNAAREGARLGVLSSQYSTA